MRIWNRTRNLLLAGDVAVANTSATRRAGLLGRTGLTAGEGLWITPCEAVHTIGMKFPIDVVFLNKRKEVVKVRAGLGPWRISGSLRAHSVLELPAGTAAGTATQPGDQLEFLRD